MIIKVNSFKYIIIVVTNYFIREVFLIFATFKLVFG